MATASLSGDGAVVQVDALEVEKVIAVKTRGLSSSVKTVDHFCLDPQFWDSYNITTPQENDEAVHQVVQVVVKQLPVDFALLSRNDTSSSSYVVALTDTSEVVVSKNGM